MTRGTRNKARVRLSRLEDTHHRYEGRHQVLGQDREVPPRHYRPALAEAVRSVQAGLGFSLLSIVLTIASWLFEQWGIKLPKPILIVLTVAWALLLIMGLSLITGCSLQKTLHMTRPFFRQTTVSHAGVSWRILHGRALGPYCPSDGAQLLFQHWDGVRRQPRDSDIAGMLMPSNYTHRGERRHKKCCCVLCAPKLSR